MKNQLTTRQRAILRSIVRSSRQYAANSNGWTSSNVTVNRRAASAREVMSIIRKVGEHRFETRIEEGTHYIPIAPFGRSSMGYKQRAWASLEVRPIAR
tara:strand:+ start:19269 stop:19562 length:294 start_codon:yes stop_codon:yes gene_type:complete